MLNAALQQKLTRLRLGGLKASLPVRLQEANASRLRHLEFLELTRISHKTAKK